MSAPQRIFTTYGEIILAVQAKLIDSGLYNSSTAYIAIDPDRTTFPPDVGSYVVITPVRDHQLINPEVGMFSGTVAITIWNLQQLDQAERNIIGVTDTSHGTLPLHDQVAGFLHLGELVNTDGDYLLARPMRLVGASDLETDKDQWDKKSYAYEVVWLYNTAGHVGAFSVSFDNDFDNTTNVVIQSTDSPETQAQLIADFADNTHGNISAGMMRNFVLSTLHILPVASDENVILPQADIVPLTIKGTAGQTADLQQFKNSSGTVLSKVDAAGEFVGNVVGNLTGNVTGNATSITGSIAESQVSNLVTDLSNKVPTSRVVTTLSPLSGGGNLSANRTLSISAATTSSAGSMSPTDKLKLDNTPIWVKVCTPTVVQQFGLGTIDGVSVSAGDRILCVYQQNGIFGPGNPEANGVWLGNSSNWTRASDVDTTKPMLVGVQYGNTLGNTVWYSPGADLNNANAISFTQIFPPVAGSGITISTTSFRQLQIAVDGSSISGVVPTTRTISTTSPLAGGGDLSADRSLSIQQADTSHDGYLGQTDWNTFNLKTTTHKTSVRLATTSNKILSGLSSSGLDGTPSAGDRILVKNQSTASANGIWIAASSSWTRATDLPTGSSPPGLSVIVTEGTRYSGTNWVCTTPGPLTIGTTSLTFQPVNAGGVQADVVLYRANGVAIPYFGTSDALRGTALRNANSAATSGDYILCGAAGFDLGTSGPFNQTSGTFIAGRGYATRIYSTMHTGINGATVWTLGDNCVVENLWLDCPNVDGTYQLPIGRSDNLSFSNARVRNVKITGQSDGVYYWSLAASATYAVPTAVFENCDIATTYDAIAVLGSSPSGTVFIFRRCNISSTGKFPGTPAGGPGLYENNVCNNRSGTCYFEFCTLTATGNYAEATNTRGGTISYDNATSIFRECTINSSASAGNVYDVQNVSGNTGSVVVSGGKGSGTNGNYLTNGTITFESGHDVPISRNVNTTSPLGGGGSLSSDLTLTIQNADSTHDGYLTQTDWGTFNSKVSTSRTISTSSPLTGGGDLSANRTISFSNQNANTALRGPTSGSAAAPTFRADVDTDSPDVINWAGLVRLTGAKYKRLYYQTTLDLTYETMGTVPSGKRWLITRGCHFNTNASSSSVTIGVQVSGTDYDLGTMNSAVQNATITSITAAPYVAEAGEIIRVKATKSGDNIFLSVVEFDNTCGLKTAKLLSLTGGYDTLYTGTGNGAYVLDENMMVNFGGIGLTTTVGVWYWNQSGATRATKLYVVPSG